MKYLLTTFIIIIFTSCGVDTASSTKEVEVVLPDIEPEIEPEVVIPSDWELVVVNPIDSNPIISTPVDLNNTDDQNSTDDPNSPDDPSPDYPYVNPNTSMFDTENALEDPNACDSDLYGTVKDASYGGQRDGENGSAGAIAENDSLVIRSEYLSQTYDDTWVKLYYRNSPSSNDIGNQGVSSYTMENVFNISYDLAWADSSISGIDNIVYVQSDKTLKPSCYRLTLNSIYGSEIDVQKVYRAR